MSKTRREINFVFQNRILTLGGTIDTLPVLRKKLGVSQGGLAAMIDVNRSTVAAIENKKRKLPWDMFLALLLVFTKNESTGKLLNVMEIYTDEFNAFIKKS